MSSDIFISDVIYILYHMSAIKSKYLVSQINYTQDIIQKLRKNLRELLQQYHATSIYQGLVTVNQQFKTQMDTISPQSALFDSYKALSNILNSINIFYLYLEPKGELGTDLVTDLVADNRITNHYQKPDSVLLSMIGQIFPHIVPYNQMIGLPIINQIVDHVLTIRDLQSQLEALTIQRQNILPKHTSPPSKSPSPPSKSPSPPSKSPSPPSKSPSPPSKSPSPPPKPSKSKSPKLKDPNQLISRQIRKQIRVILAQIHTFIDQQKMIKYQIKSLEQWIDREKSKFVTQMAPAPDVTLLQDLPDIDPQQSLTPNPWDNKNFTSCLNNHSYQYYRQFIHPETQTQKLKGEHLVTIHQSIIQFSDNAKTEIVQNIVKYHQIHDAISDLESQYRLYMDNIIDRYRQLSSQSDALTVTSVQLQQVLLQVDQLQQLCQTDLSEMLIVQSTQINKLFKQIKTQIIQTLDQINQQIELFYHVCYGRQQTNRIYLHCLKKIYSDNFYQLIDSSARKSIETHHLEQQFACTHHQQLLPLTHVDHYVN